MTFNDLSDSFQSPLYYLRHFEFGNTLGIHFVIKPEHLDVNSNLVLHCIARSIHKVSNYTIEELERRLERERIRKARKKKGFRNVFRKSDSERIELGRLAVLIEFVFLVLIRFLF